MAEDQAVSLYGSTVNRRRTVGLWELGSGKLFLVQDVDQVKKGEGGRKPDLNVGSLRDRVREQEQITYSWQGYEPLDTCR